MKILLWADIHCEHSVHGDNLRGAGSTSLTVDWLVSHALRERPDCVFVLGDLFDDHGLIESSLAVSIRNNILRLSGAGIKIVLVTGNHEYQAVTESFFGKGLVEALFGGREDQGVFVVDAEARAIHLDEKTALIGIPYRATKEQFTQTVVNPILEEIERLGHKQVVIGWHCGVPNAAAWRGDEPENAFISEENAEIKMLFDLSHDRRIYCGHYHGPGDTPFGDMGTFTYVGSPSTRSIAESDQVKRVLVWEDGVVRAVDTGLILDHVADSVEGVKAHVDHMIALHGPLVRPLLKIRIRLPKGSSMDDYNRVKTSLKTTSLGTQIAIDRPEVRQAGLADDIIEKAARDPSYTQSMMELDVLIRSIMTTYAPPDSSPPTITNILTLASLQDGEINDEILFERLFKDHPGDKKQLGTVGRMLLYAVKLANQQA